MLEDRFEEWIPTVGVGPEQREIFWALEDWGAEVPKTMKKDRDEQKAAMRKARGDLYLSWSWKVRILCPSATLIMAPHSQKPPRFSRNPSSEVKWKFSPPTTPWLTNPDF